MKIRLLKKQEINNVIKIIEENYSKKWVKLYKTEVSEMFDNKKSKPKYFVVERDKTLIGFAGYCQSWMDYQIYEITWINILPRFQYKGIGTLLLSKLIQEIKKEKFGSKPRLILLFCENKLIIFYKKFGFEIIQKINKKESLMSLKLN
jgi:ribosomal protein S18 acetylase RimI-like enzyme